MPQEFQSMNPTQVGQGNNIVYQPVNQQYGQLFAQGLGRVAAQKAKAAKDAQEKEYEFKGKFKGSSTYAPEIMSNASNYFQKIVTDTPDLTRNAQKRNEYSAIANTMTNDAKSIADIEDRWNKVADVANTDTSGNVSNILTNLAKDKTIALAKKESTKGKDPIESMRIYAGVMSSNQPNVAVRKSLQKEAERGDVYQKASWESPLVDTTNNPDYYKQSKGERLSIRKDNYKALYNQYRNDDAIRNDYRHNDLMSADTPIKNDVDADNFIAEKFYGYGNKSKKIDKDKFANDEDYRKQVINEAYANQEKSIDERIDATLKGTLGITQDASGNYTKDTKYGYNLMQAPGASGRGKQEQEMGVSVTGSGTIFKNPNEEQNLSATETSAKIGTKGLDLAINPSTVSNLSLFTEQGTKAPMGSSFNKLTDMHKVYMISDANGNENVPLILYKEKIGDDGKKSMIRYTGNVNDAIKGGLGSYKIVDPNHINKAGEIDPKNHLISYDDFKTKYGRWDIVPGYAMTLSNTEKATTTGGLNETSTAPLTDVSSVVGYIPQSKAGKNQILKMLSEQKIGNTPYAKLDEATGNFEFVGKDLWNNTKLRSVDKATGKFRASSGSVNEGAFGKYKGKSKR